MNKLKKSIVSLLCLAMLCMTTPAFAATWSHFYNGPNKSLYFSVSEYTGSGYIVVPAPITVAGAWQEYWDGTQDGLATLLQLYQMAEALSIDSVMFDIDNLAPSACYNNRWFTIQYPYTWTLTSPSNEYTVVMHGSWRSENYRLWQQSKNHIKTGIPAIKVEKPSLVTVIKEMASSSLQHRE